MVRLENPQRRDDSMPLTIREYGCTRCQKWHTEAEPLFKDHLAFQSKQGIRSRLALDQHRPTSCLTPAMVLSVLKHTLGQPQEGPVYSCGTNAVDIYLGSATSERIEEAVALARACPIVRMAGLTSGQSYLRVIFTL
jgi:hypothetical protein